MADSAGSLARHAAIAACLIILSVSRASGQLPTADVPPAFTFMPRSDFQVSLKSLNSNDDRFSWDGRIAAVVDIIDYVYGRTSIVADYQAVMGSEFRPFDVNQGNYELAASSSVRVGPLEFAGVFHHISRHLSDRPKRLAIAWNDVDGEVLGEFFRRGATIELRAVAGKMTAHSYVDYGWTANADLLVRRPLNRHIGVYGRVFGNVIGIDKALSQRDQQRGGRVEAGVRLPGPGGVMELFGGYERIIDADPFEQLPRAWGFLGLRILNR